MSKAKKRSAAGLSLFNRTLSRCMGLWGDGQTLYLSTLFQLWRFENSLGPGEIYQGYDRLYVPQIGWTTGDLVPGLRQHAFQLSRHRERAP